MPGAAVIANWLTTSEWFSGVPSLCCESLAVPSFGDESLVLAVVSMERLEGGFLDDETLSVPSLSGENVGCSLFAVESLDKPSVGSEVVAQSLIYDEVVASPILSGESIMQLGWLDAEIVIMPILDVESVLVPILESESIITANRDCEC